MGLAKRIEAVKKVLAEEILPEEQEQEVEVEVVEQTTKSVAERFAARVAAKKAKNDSVRILGARRLPKA